MSARPESPIPYIPIGAVVALLGAGAIIAGRHNAWAVLGGIAVVFIGQVTLAVSVVAAGVEWGNARSRTK